MADDLATSDETQDEQPMKIGGWLYLIGFLVYTNPFRTLSSILSDQVKGLQDGSVVKLITPGNEFYHPMYFPSVALNFFSTLVIFLIQLILIYLFVKKDKIFPKVYSYLLFLNFLSFWLVYICVASYPNPVKEVVTSLYKGSLGATIAGIIWIPYMFKSLRVRQTFVKESSAFALFKSLKFKLIPVLGFLIFFSWALILKNSEGKESLPKKEVQSNQLSPKDIAQQALENFLVIETFDKSGEDLGIGSGFFILPSIVVTNAHVVKDAYSLKLRYANSKKNDFALEIIAIDEVSDLALIKTDKFKANSPLKLGDAESLSIGTKIYALGNPQGLEGTFTDGLVSNRLVYDGLDIVQISAPISQGSSGGPILDSSGKVVGISTAYLKDGQNLNLAIPSTYISRLIMKTDSFYPLATNTDLTSNPSISNLFPKVCSKLIDFNLSDEYFIEVSDKDLNDEKGRTMCATALPSCKRAWVAKGSGEAVLMGAVELSPSDFVDVSRLDFEKIITTMMENTKEGYRESDPNTKFVTSTVDLNQHIFQMNIQAQYIENNNKHTDFRSYYFLLPYCRLDLLYSAPGEKKEFDDKFYELLSNSFKKTFPGNKSQKALFNFNK